MDKQLEKLGGFAKGCSDSEDAQRIEFEKIELKDAQIKLAKHNTKHC